MLLHPGIFVVNCGLQSSECFLSLFYVHTYIALAPFFPGLEKKMFDNQMLILSELRSIRSAVTSAKETGVLRLPEDCPALPVSTAEELFVLDEYSSSEGKMEKLVSSIFTIFKC